MYELYDMAVLADLASGYGMPGTVPCRRADGGWHDAWLVRVQSNQQPYVLAGRMYEHANAHGRNMDETGLLPACLMHIGGVSTKLEAEIYVTD